MNTPLEIVINPNTSDAPELLRPYDREAARRARRFHQSFPAYAKTPLCDLRDTAASLGLGRLWVKDESKRFGLNAFKVLGGSYGVASLIAKALGRPVDDLPYPVLSQMSGEGELNDFTLITATDGNHGRGIAWMASRLGIPAHVYMPMGTTPRRLQHIRDLGVHAEITNLNYDDTVDFVFREAAKNGWYVTQDTTGPGYTDFPTWCQQGYLTLLEESVQDMEDLSPTHVFVQAGVGTLAAAAAAFFAVRFGENRPRFIVVEPTVADCFVKTARADRITAATGDLAAGTIMAGLACGIPSSVAWPILRAYTDAFVSCGDDFTRRGMRLLARPVGDDPQVVSGESGAVGVGLVAQLMTNPAYEKEREKLSLSQNSRVYCISTEGDTDPDRYREIVFGE